MTVYHENTATSRNIYLHKYQVSLPATLSLHSTVQDTSVRMTGFFRLMAKWRGSVSKLIYHNFIIFVIFYYFISFLYRFVFKRDPYQKVLFNFNWLNPVCIVNNDCFRKCLRWFVSMRADSWATSPQLFS